MDGYEANTSKRRAFRIGVDASIWFRHAKSSKEGENPELRTIFFRLTRLLKLPFLPLFVFDGPMRPDVKRGKMIDKKPHWMVDGMKRMIEAFGFEWRTVCLSNSAGSVCVLIILGPWRSRSRTRIS